MKNQFKVGDRVYHPYTSGRIYTLGSITSSLIIQTNEGSYLVTKYGCRYDNAHCHMPTIFHATQENYELLSKLYPDVEFEKPPVRKEPKEIIEAMFDDGWHYVNFRIYRIYGNQKFKDKVITKQQFYTINFDDYLNKYADCNIGVADPRTGKVIIDYIDGEIVTE